ncbi:Signal recognition particle subunit SRP72, partial [Caligus rogercresseyi]
FFGGSKKVPRVSGLPSTDKSRKENGDLVEKKKKLPMNYDLNVEPDPERWIPNGSVSSSVSTSSESGGKRQKSSQGHKATIVTTPPRRPPRVLIRKLLYPPPQGINNKTF